MEKSTSYPLDHVEMCNKILLEIIYSFGFYFFGYEVEHVLLSFYCAVANQVFGICVCPYLIS